MDKISNFLKFLSILLAYLSIDISDVILGP